MTVTYSAAPADLPRLYSQADAKLQGRCAKRRKVANNTWLERRDEDIALRLHETDVVTFHRDGTVTLSTGGWFTVTTKSRINDALPGHLRVCSERGRWFLYVYGTKHAAFNDGMRVDLDSGDVVSGGFPHDDLVRQDAANADARKAIERYLRRITPERIIEAFDNPGGDCILCRWPGREHEADHLRQHVDEDYFMFTLALNAIKARGFRDPYFCIQMIRSDAERGKVDRYFLTASLRKYLRKALITGVAVK